MVEEWKPVYAEAAIQVVRAVFDEYSFTWDEDDYHADLYDVPRHYLSHGHSFFVAVIDGQVKGTVALETFDRIPGQIGTIVELNDETRVGGTDCSLNRLYVHPSSRRNGIGFALTSRVIQEAQNRGCSAMEIWSDKRFTEAHKLYERLGAKIVGDRIGDDPDLSPEWGLLLNP